MLYALRTMASLKAWLRTILLGLLGGVLGALYTVVVEPESYRLPQDFASGKMWKFFLGGSFLTIAGILVESPLGKKLMHPFEGEKGNQERNQ